MIIMTRRDFYSFHYKPDCYRAAQIRNMSVVAGNKPASIIHAYIIFSEK